MNDPPTPCFLLQNLGVISLNFCMKNPKKLWRLSSEFSSSILTDLSTSEHIEELGPGHPCPPCRFRWIPGKAKRTGRKNRHYASEGKEKLQDKVYAKDLVQNFLSRGALDDSYVVRGSNGFFMGLNILQWKRGSVSKDMKLREVRS